MSFVCQRYNVPKEKIALFFSNFIGKWYIYRKGKDGGEYLHEDGTWRDTAVETGLYRTKRLAILTLRKFRIKVDLEYKISSREIVNYIY